MTTSHPSQRGEDPLWTLEELRAHAEALLEAEEIASGSGRVRAIPDERTLRYYTTLGLLSGPARLKGRKAFYDRRHLAQVVAIKRLQALGMSLAQIQQELAGATPREVESMARLPKVLPEPLLVVSCEPSAPKRAFWQEAVATPSPLRETRQSGTWLELAPGFVILLSHGCAPSEQARQALIDAASPLRAEMLRQGLLLSKTPSGDDHA